nr:MAG TPA: hypothetical protein [Caudoviricetes sp.]
MELVYGLCYYSRQVFEPCRTCGRECSPASWEDYFSSY